MTISHAPFLRRMEFAATNQGDASTVPDLMARIEEAEVRARVQRAREEAGLSQPQFADLLGVIPRTVQNYESRAGKDARTPWGQLNEISEITGRSLKWLLHGDDDEATQLADRLDHFERQQEEIKTEQASIKNALDALKEQQGLLTDAERETLAEVAAA